MRSAGGVASRAELYRPRHPAGSTLRRRTSLTDGSQPGHRIATSRTFRTSIFPVMAEKTSLEDSRRRLEHRIGLNVPYEWWPGGATLKAIEAAGFRWVQVATPPVEMLADPRHGVRHATALRGALEVTELCTVVHGPTSLRLGNALHNRAFGGPLEDAPQNGAR